MRKGMAEQTKELETTDEKFYIDKSAGLEQALKEYPCVYLEGAAASGKTTAVRMLCRRQENLSVLAVCAGEEELETYGERIRRFLNPETEQKGRNKWIFIEGVPGTLTEEEKTFFLTLIPQLGPRERLILEGRDDLPEAFLDLLWKGKIQLIVQESLMLTRTEVVRLAAERNSFLNASELYEETGGWAGCVDLLLRLTARPPVRMGNIPSVREILRRREVQEYLEKEILCTLSPEEQEVLRWLDLCPWTHPDLCREIFQTDGSVGIIESLERKGILVRCCKKRLWKKLPLFVKPAGPERAAERWSAKRTEAQMQTVVETPEKASLESAGVWFDRKGFPAQALFCLKKAGDRTGYLECLRSHCAEIPFSGISPAEGFVSEDSSPEGCYLRGMEAVVHHDWDALQEEIRLTEQQKDQKDAAEIWLNLSFANPLLSLEDWMKALKRTAKTHGPLRLYHILGGSFTFLCGLRDLSGLFVGGRKAERKQAELWKNSLGPEEWKAYQFARMEFYLETKQRDRIPDEDWKLLLTLEEKEDWTTLFARYWLLIKLRRSPDTDPVLAEEEEEAENAVRKMLGEEENPVCRQILEAADALRGSGGGEKILFSWVREKRFEWSDEIREETVGMWYLRAAACYEIQQYDRTEKILKKLIPFARSGRRSRMLAECLFQQAAVNWSRENRKKSLQDVVESFLVTGEFRYVRFYTRYGRNGYEVLEDYIEWLSNNSPDTWSRKKKYNYGNVLNMPMEDYMNVILREAKKNRGQTGKRLSEETEEPLTVTEIIVLKELSTGMTNEEICADLNLKLTTVKGHIYSIYKKLGVKSRVQALLIGRERGLLRGE